VHKKDSQFLKIFGIFFSCLVVSHCTVGPDFHSPKSPEATSYSSNKLRKKTLATPGAKNAANAQQFNIEQQIPNNWWHLFHSNTYDNLVAQGFKNSPTLSSAKATLQEAQASLQVQIGELLFPAIDFSADSRRARASTIAYGGPGTNSIFNLYDTTASVSYMLDVFGRSRRTIEAYKAQIDYEQYELTGTYLSLSANIMTTGIAIASLEDQIKATKALIKEQTEILKILRKQYHYGGVSKTDVLLQETTLAQTQAKLPSLEDALAQSKHALAVLTGQYTSELTLPKLTLNQLTLPKNLPLSLPSKLVKQRPDIQASVALLHAANAEIGVATAELFPELTLSGNFGYLSQTTKDFFSHQNNVWNYGLGLTQPVFHGGALWAQRKMRIAAHQVAFANYQKTVLHAFENVSNVLSAIELDAVEYNRRFAANDTARKTMNITKKQYYLGGVDYLTVLNAEEKYQETQLDLIKAQAARYSDTVALYQALGGGWWNTVSTKKRKGVNQ